MAKPVKRLYFGFIQRIKRIFYSFRKNDIYVLMFHDVYDGENNNPAINVNKNNFIDFINALRRRNVKFIGIDDIFLNSEEEKVIITFDDVYEGVVLNAIPLLNELHIPFTLFIAPCFIDKEGYIKSSQIKELKNNPLCTIGFHTNNHKLMRNLSKTEANNEIDCNEFERKYGVHCEYFAYPYGSVYACAKRNIDLLAKSNYKMAFSTINSAVSENFIKRNRVYIPRINVCDNTWESILNKKIKR